MVSTDRIDGLTTEVALKAPVKVATTGNITLSGEQTIDGVAVTEGERVLVQNQTTASENGIYLCQTTTWSRAKDWNGQRDVVQGTRVYIQQGTTYAGYQAQVTTSGDITIGTTSVAFSLSLIVDGTIAADLATVAAIDTDVTTVAGISTDVTAVAGVVGDVSAVASQVVGWTFSNSTTMSDPGDGNIRFNNATLANVTAIAVDDLDSDGTDVSAYLVAWGDSTNPTSKGVLTIRTAAGDLVIFNVTALTDNAGWVQLTVTHVASTGTFSDSESVYASYARAGDQGDVVVSDETPLVAGVADAGTNTDASRSDHVHPLASAVEETMTNKTLDDFTNDVHANTLHVNTRNVTGSTITSLSVVYVTGASGQTPTIALADASTEGTSAATIGVVAADIVDNATGAVVLSGMLEDVDTSAFNDGDTVFLDTTAGAMTASPPPASPNHLVIIGHVAYAHATQGKLFVTIQNGWELEELHDVLISSVTDGQTIVWDATNGYWKNADSLAAAPVENRIINGVAPFINQRGAQTGMSNGDYFVDRWQYVAGGTPTAVVDGDVTSSGGEDWVEVDVTTADAALAAGDVYYVSQKVEANNIVDFYLGTASAATVTLSFKHAHTKTGTYCVAFRNSAANRAYVAEYTQSVADTEESSTVTLTLDTSGTWATGTGVGLSVGFCMGSGSTFQTTADSWQAGNYLATANQVNALDNASNFFRIRDVQLELGSVATDPVFEKYGDKLQACQRYYVNQGSAEYCTGGVYAASARLSRPHTYPVTMRASPTLAITTGSSGGVGTVTTTGNSAAGFTSYAAATGANTAAFYDITYTADAEL